EFSDGSKEEVRVLGVDTPETAANADAELPHEWEGLGDDDGKDVDGKYSHLASWSKNATDFATQELQGKEVTLTFDRNEGISDPYGRILTYVQYDGGTYYPKNLIEKGYARVYDSGLKRHDDFLRAEIAARKSGTGVWAKSDPGQTGAMSPKRNTSISELYFPKPRAITVEDGSLRETRIPVFAEQSASTSEAPLVGIDAEARVAMVGAPFIDEYYEQELGFPVSTAEYCNFAFLT
ncbi:MAG: thermonuclease family protein, partial [Halobacteriaceae archaeon]